jgi:hypothetical protein
MLFLEQHPETATPQVMIMLSLAGTRAASTQLRIVIPSSAAGQEEAIQRAAGTHSLAEGAGQVNETGQSNSFFGNFAGESNTIGSRNTFFGSDAGRTNTTGGNNTILGFFADLGANNLTNATAIGYRARVDASDSLVLGSIDGINSATSTTRVGIGTTTPTERLHVVGNSIVSGNLMVGGTITGTFNGTITTADNALNLGGLPAAQFVQTTDPRMSDARDPLAGSPAYVQNQSVGPQPATNFNISGSGSAVVFNASTQYNIGGERMLSTPGVENLFLGFHAGFSNTTGSGNAFFGRQAGFSNTTGGSNAFFGPGAGYSNTSGGSNSFFGSGAGQNTSTGVQNVFIGREAGGANSTGSNNTIIGSFATLGSGALRNASAIGALAQADSSNSLILGSVNGVNGANETVKVGIGTTAPTERLHVVGNQLITGDLNVGGAIVGNFSGTISNAVNADNLGGIPAAQYAQVSAVDNLDAANITSGTLSNARLGVVPTANGGTGLATPGPGGHFLRSNGSIWISSPMQSSDFPANNPSYIQNTTSLQISSNFNISGNGTADSFDAGSHYAIGGIRVLGATAGLSQNTFAGLLAGNSNPTGSSNSFFGFNAGTNASSGNQNSFFGARAGQATSAGSANSFFGTSAGQANVADGNSFFGNAAGLLNTLGGHNTFIGREAGRNNTEGFDNTFVGKDAGDTNTGGFRNTVIGESADVMSAGLTNATAIGSRAAVAQSNSLVLGSINGVNFAAADTNVGIGTTTPRTKLDVTGGDIFLGTPGKAVILRSPDGGCWSLSVNNTGALTTVSVICP